LPAFSILATAASNQHRRPAVLHVLETTIISWQKQIKNLLKQEPEVARMKNIFYTKEEIQLWTTRINKLNNLKVQLDAAYVKDILMNLENNNSVYVQSFTNIKDEIEAVRLMISTY
jgi:dynein heavy chain